MCTAINYKTKNNYFGRNLDLEYSYNETVTITPRNYEFVFHKEKAIKSHYALIGMAYVKDGYPLYYDATNEKGLSMAGLNFPENAFYFPIMSNKQNITPFELIPYILGCCKSIAETKELLENINIVDIPYSDELPLSPLHWIVSDKEENIVIESTKNGLEVYDNPVGVLTNNPPFEMQLFNLNNYMHLSEGEPVNTFRSGLKQYSKGMGAIGMPGDWSSQSRFVRAVFVKEKSVAEYSEEESVSQFFHMLSSVEMPRGCIKVGSSYEITVYSSCCNTDKGIYYYKTYNNMQISGVDMFREKLDGDMLINYPLITDMKIKIQN